MLSYRLRNIHIKGVQRLLDVDGARALHNGSIDSGGGDGEMEAWDE